MDISVEKKGPCLHSLKVVIPPDRIEEALGKKYKEARQAVSLPGFRKGKVPEKLIAKKFGETIDKEVKEDLIRDAYTRAIDEHKLEPVDDPEIDIEAIDMKSGEPMEFEFELETRPEFELGEYKGIKAEVPTLTVSDEEIDKGVDGLRGRFSSLQKVEGEPVKKGDFLTATVTYSVEGEEALVREGCQVNTMMGIADGVEIGPEAAELFIGKKAGESAAFEVNALPETFNPESHRGRAAKVAAEIAEIKRITPPELDDKFFKMVGVESLEELKDKVREGTALQKERMREELVDERIIDKLIETNTFSLPEKLLEKQIMRQEYARKMEMARMGLPAEQIKERAEELKEHNEKSAERFLHYSFVFDKIAEKEKIFVMESDVEAELKSIALSRNSTPQDVRADFEENEMMSSLRARIREDKIRKLLRDKAEIVEIEAMEEVADKDAPAEAAGEDASSASSEPKA